MIRASVFALAVALAACSPPAETPPPAPPAAEMPASAPMTAAEATAQDTCGAVSYRSMIGTSIAAATFPADPNIRVIMPDAVVTHDFRPERLNVIVDAGGVIASLECY